MTNRSYDARSVANLILENASQKKLLITNLALQKLLYFAHGLFLVSYKRPLVGGYFEAWQYGPVHPLVYQSFKAAGDQPISFRATGRDPLHGTELPLVTPVDDDVNEIVERVRFMFGTISPGRLVEISHAKGAPWDFVVSQADARVAFGMRISDDVISSRFKYHKVAIGSVPRTGEPLEDTPFA